MLAVTIVSLSLGQILLKKGVSASPLQFTAPSIIKTIFNPYVFLGYVTYFISSILGLFVLKKFPLSVAFPSMSVTYVIILIVSVLFFQEKLTMSKILAIVAIIGGVGMLLRG